MEILESVGPFTFSWSCVPWVKHAKLVCPKRTGANGNCTHCNNGGHATSIPGDFLWFSHILSTMDFKKHWFGNTEIRRKVAKEWDNTMRIEETITQICKWCILQTCCCCSGGLLSSPRSSSICGRPKRFFQFGASVVFRWENLPLEKWVHGDGWNHQITAVMPSGIMKNNCTPGYI